MKHDYNIAHFFENILGIGKVWRVDQITRGRDSRVYTYVHFDHWYDNETAKQVREKIDTDGEFICTGYHDGTEFLKFSFEQSMKFKSLHSATEENEKLVYCVEQLKRDEAWLKDQHSQLRKEYTQSSEHLAGFVTSMMSREAKIRELEKEIQELKESS